ncbi:MAG TPA: acetate--CoA ligase family protein [Acetobacteraceae bacterium]|jgi:acyl-CoA synthetase (NDP forming)|nr:acetate--CoA ligase family protein [Acetobacteraceae bacterium]
MPRDLTAMLRPRSIALVGATDRSRWSQNTFDNLINRKYAGAVHLISRRGGIVHGRPAATSCVTLGEPIDLALLMVPLAAIDEAFADLAAAKVHNAVILTSGFAETGHDGAQLQSHLSTLARRHDVSLLGPNCLGFVNFIDNVPLWTGGFRAPGKPGGIAVVTQSGANGSFISSLAAQHEIGLSHMVSTGNEADLDCAAFIEHLIDQPEVRAIALFAETIRHAPSFAAAARRAITAAKPIVVLKIGLSEITARSAAAHTGALVGDDRVFDGVCRQLGIVRVDSIEDLLFTADVIARTGVLKPNGLAAVSISGGACEIIADRAQVLNVPLPELSASATAELRAALPSFGTPHNPLDITGAGVLQPDLFEQGLRILGKQPEYSVLACLFDVPVSAELATEFTRTALGHIAAGLHAASMPAFMISHTTKPVTDVATQIIEEIGLPYISCGIHHAMNALGAAFWWSDQYRRLADVSATITTIADAKERPTSERNTLDYLKCSGVPVVPNTLARDADQAVTAARDIGGRVVLKIASDDITHKSDIGGVILNLEGDGTIRDAFQRIIAAAPTTARVDGVLVAPMRSGGLELFVGCTRDPQWGPVIAVGLGGVWVEVLQDVALRPLPIDAAEVKRMLTELRGAKMLEGIRGMPAADLDTLAAVIARIGDAAVALGDNLEALEVNPLWVRGSDVEALDALAVWIRSE